MPRKSAKPYAHGDPGRFVPTFTGVQLFHLTLRNGKTCTVRMEKGRWDGQPYSWSILEAKLASGRRWDLQGLWTTPRPRYLNDRDDAYYDDFHEAINYLEDALHDAQSRR